MNSDSEAWGRAAPVMTIERTADALMCSPTTVRRLIAEGKLAAETCTCCGGQIVRQEVLAQLFGCAEQQGRMGRPGGPPRARMRWRGTAWVIDLAGLRSAAAALTAYELAARSGVGRSTVWRFLHGVQQIREAKARAIVINGIGADWNDFVTPEPPALAS